LEQEPLTRLIAATRRQIKQAVGRRLRPHRLSPQRFWVLVNLHEAPGLSLRQLAERLRIDEPTASRIVSGLSRLKLVRARRPASDRRRQLLQLTPAGRAMARELDSVAEEVRRAAEAGFTREEIDTLRQLLRRVIDNMKGLHEAPRVGENEP
jgi:MarR family transcriptional regulator for hemolysin